MAGTGTTANVGFILSKTIARGKRSHTQDQFVTATLSGNDLGKSATVKPISDHLNSANEVNTLPINSAGIGTLWDWRCHKYR